LKQNSHHFLNTPLNLEAMKTAAAALLGQHDFSAFKSSNRQKINPVCRVDRAEILNKGEGELEFWISADHFVYNMVRIIVGTLIEVGLNKRAPSDLSEALAGKDRHLAGPTAPPWGLCLYSVDYPAEFNLFQKDSQNGSCE
jgi:tRNA pseudouridine38-40 synthase